MPTATDADLYQGWGTVGLRPDAGPLVADLTLPVHSTVTSAGGFVVSLNDALEAAAAVAGPNAQQVVESHGIFTLNEALVAQPYVTLRVPRGEALTLRPALPGLAAGVNVHGDYLQPRSCSLSGNWNETTATVTDPSAELTVGRWQLGGNDSDGPGAQQIEITAVDGSTVTLAEPLTQTFVSIEMLTMNPGDEWIERVGLEGDIRVEALADLDDLISFRSAVDCWIVGGLTTNGVAANDDDGQQRSAVFLRQSSHLFMDGFSIDNADEHGDGGKAYGVNFSASSQVLISNGSITRMRHSVLIHAGASGNVIWKVVTGEPLHPNPPNGGATELNGHGYGASNAFIKCITGRIMFVDAGQPGPHNAIVETTVYSGPLTLDGTDTNQLVDTVLISNLVTGDVVTLSQRVMESLATDSTAGNPSPRRPFWNDQTVGANGEYGPGPTDPASDPFRDQGLGLGVYLPNPTQVDLSRVYTSTAPASTFPALARFTDPETVPVELSLAAHSGEHGDQSRTVPLSDFAGPNRQAVLITGWQAEAHGTAAMGARPAEFTEPFRRSRGTGTSQSPGGAVWTADIPEGTQDLDLPIGHGGCGWLLYVTEGADLAEVEVVAVTATQGSSYGVTGEGFDGLTIGVVVTNGNTTVSVAGGLALTAPPPHYSEPAGGHTINGTNGTLSFGATDFLGFTVRVPSVDIAYLWSFVGREIVEGVRYGDGIGSDVTTTDQNGVTIAPGETTLVVDESWTVTPQPPPREKWWTRVELPADFDPTQGFEVEMQLLNADNDSPLGPSVVCEENIIGGETEVIATADLEMY